MDYLVLKWIHVLSSSILQPVSGLALVHMLQLEYSTPWVAWSLALYAVAIALWLPVVVIQIRMRNVMAHAHRTGGPVPAAYDRMFHWWTGLGCAAFVVFLLIFWLMVAKRLPWAA